MCWARHGVRTGPRREAASGAGARLWLSLSLLRIDFTAPVAKGTSLKPESWACTHPSQRLSLLVGNESPKSHIDANLRVSLPRRARVREVLPQYRWCRIPGRLSGLWKASRAHDVCCRVRLQGIRVLSDGLRQERPSRRAPTRGEIRRGGDE